ncbi:MAG: methyltransferase [Oscillospiraceae bacterium]|nr:methyltransferase [Oscillospiraceae bacterium]
MSHYFKPSPHLPEQETQIIYHFAGKKFAFATNSGLFSRAHVDPASEILMQTLGSTPPLSGQSLLDMGCGYGVIGIVLAKTYGLALTQADVNPRALEYARRNAVANQVATNTIQSDCFAEVTGKFHIITINPPIHAGKVVTYQMYEESAVHLEKGGSLYVVTLKKHGAESTGRKLMQVFGNCKTIYKKNGYYVFQAIQV